MNFRPTAQCRKLPSYIALLGEILPLNYLTDGDIDLALQHMLERGAPLESMPVTQYGRRAAVASYIKMEQIRPISPGSHVPTPFEPSQPR